MSGGIQEKVLQNEDKKDENRKLTQQETLGECWLE